MVSHGRLFVLYFISYQRVKSTETACKIIFIELYTGYLCDSMAFYYYQNTVRGLASTDLAVNT